MKMGDCLINVLSAVIAIEYMDHGFPKKYHGWMRLLCFLAGCGVYFLVVTGINMVTEFESVAGFLYGLLVICYGFAALKGKPEDIFLYGILWMVIVLIGTYAVYGVIGLMTGKDLQELVAAEWGFRYYASLSVAASFLVMFFLIHGMFSLELCHRRLWKYHEENMELSHKKALETGQQENMKELYRMVREVNRIRHDMNGKLDVLYYLLEKEDYEKARSYITEIHDVLSQYPEIPRDTGNTGLNAALFRASGECREKGIRFHFSILGSPKKIDSMDIGVLLHNLFRNGIEACMEVQPEKERRLELVVIERKDETELEVLNSIGHSIFLENPNLKSRKKDRERHGFGMPNIYRIIKKYHGEYGCREEEDYFVQMITLKHFT